MIFEKTSLYDLGIEYEKHAKLQDSFIEHCKADIKKAKEQGDRDALHELQSNLYKFYEIKRELLNAAEQLKKYYEGENNGKKNN